MSAEPQLVPRANPRGAPHTRGARHAAAPPREELLTGAVLITPHSARGVRGGSSSHWLARRQELLTRRCSPRRGNFHALRVRSSSHSLASVESSFCPGAHHVQHIQLYNSVMQAHSCAQNRALTLVHVGGLSYRAERVEQMVNDHDERLHAVVDLARWNGSRASSVQRISRQLSHLILRWSCNARDVHLLRTLPRRVVGEAARKHDQSIKVAVAIMQGKYQMPSRTCEESGDAMYLHRVTDADLPQEFLRSYVLANDCHGSTSRVAGWIDAVCIRNIFKFSGRRIAGTKRAIPNSDR